MNIANKLTAFAQEELVLSRNDTEREKINGSLQQLEHVLRSKLSTNIREFVRFGSFTRNTILPRKYDPESDVDLMVVFDTTLQMFKPETHRNKLIEVIATAYPNSISKKDFPVVKLELNHIMFDLVPAYSSYLWAGRSYYIPAKNNEWQLTVPNDINESLSRMNQNYGNNVVRNVIRLCKHWNAFAGYPLESYQMEKRIVNMLFWWGDNLYDKFLSTLDNLAGTRPGVRQALDNIKMYRGNGWALRDEEKQILWLKKLLPGFN